MEWREAGGTRWLEAQLPGAMAVFTTRVGGASSPPFDGLNLGAFAEDQPASVIENRRQLALALGHRPEQIAIGHQVHGAELANHAEPQTPSPYAVPGSPILQIDGHVTEQVGLPLLAFVADCVPVALSGPAGVAMLHCGWRGLAAGIIAKGAQAIGATDAAIGPSIGPCCYEVGPEVLDALRGPTGRNPNPRSENRPGGRVVDLAGIARRQLLDAGVEQIELSGLCTSCEPELFFSHRRDRGRTGRQAGLVWRNGGDG